MTAVTPPMPGQVEAEDDVVAVAEVVADLGGLLDHDVADPAHVQRHRMPSGHQRAAHPGGVELVRQERGHDVQGRGRLGVGGADEQLDEGVEGNGIGVVVEVGVGVVVLAPPGVGHREHRGDQGRERRGVLRAQGGAQGADQVVVRCVGAVHRVQGALLRPRRGPVRPVLATSTTLACHAGYRTMPAGCLDGSLSWVGARLVREAGLRLRSGPACRRLDAGRGDA